MYILLSLALDLPAELVYFMLIFNFVLLLKSLKFMLQAFQEFFSLFLLFLLFCQFLFVPLELFFEGGDLLPVSLELGVYLLLLLSVGLEQLFDLAKLWLVSDDFHLYVFILRYQIGILVLEMFFLLVFHEKSLLKLIILLL